MILMDEEEPSGLDLTERIMSQCVLMTPELINNNAAPLGPNWLQQNTHRVNNAVLKFASMMGWLNERSERVPEIPFADAERGYLPNTLNKWSMDQTKEGILIWISDKAVRTEFVLTWM